VVRFLRLALSASVLAALGGCGPDYSPNTYASGAVQQANKVEQGVIVGVRQVDVSTSGAVGAIVGGAAGGIAGSQAPGGGVGAAFGALGGALVGGIVGTTVEHATTDTTAFEYVVRKGNGELVSVTQKDAEPLPLGQKVLVIAGNQARIVPDYTVPVAEPKPAPGKDKPAETDKQPDKDKPPGAAAAAASVPATVMPATVMPATTTPATPAAPPTPASELAKALSAAPTPLPLPGVSAETHQP
jgi:outer membrane lipoprotein SlyB